MTLRAFNNFAVALSMALTLAACGGGSGGSTPPPDPAPPPPAAPAPAPVSKSEAYRFLNQATFGATEAEADRLMAMGYEAWLDEQLAAPASLQLPYMLTVPPQQFPAQLQADRVDVWFRNAINGQDQLRQRVAFALSEIMVVSQQGALAGAPFSLASYYDMLAEGAFGNYRDLIENVTLHPAMGVYLSMLGNEKPNPALNIRPDENYARELMQLFSIGLVELNLDGTEVLDGGGLPVPTYNQATIEGFAHVFTGWSYAGGSNFRLAFPLGAARITPMQLYPDFHDTGAKTLLGGTTLPARNDGEQDLADALDNIFDHPNVGPFIAIRLIQRLTTSNPSPGYVARVAGVFNNDGNGARGNLGAVVRAILLDAEARPAATMEIDGKLKEPLLRVTQLWRNYDGVSPAGGYRIPAAFVLFGQGPLQSPSVFNFFSPSYAPPGEIRNSSLVAPELQIATEYQNTLFTNFMFYQTFAYNLENPAVNEPGNAQTVFIDFSEELAIADDVDLLIDTVAGKLLGGTISETLRGEISSLLSNIPPADASLRAAETIYFIVTSPEYALQL